MPMMGYREYARHRGCVLQAVQRAIKAGRILAIDKKIDSEDADRRWAATTDPAKQRKEPPAPPPVVLPLLGDGPVQAPPMRRPVWPECPDWPPPLPKATDQQRPPGNVLPMDTFLAAKTDRERAEADMARLELAEKLRTLTSAEGVRQAFVGIGKMFAQARENVPFEVAPELIGKTDIDEIERIIRNAFRAADAKIANDIQTKFAEFVDGAASGLAG
jgi:hypothetical protein